MLSLGDREGDGYAVERHLEKESPQAPICVHINWSFKDGSILISFECQHAGEGHLNDVELSQEARAGSSFGYFWDHADY